MRSCAELKERVDNCKLSQQRKKYSKSSNDPAALKRKRKKEEPYVMPNSVQILGDDVHQLPVFQHSCYQIESNGRVPQRHPDCIQTHIPRLNGDLSLTNPEHISIHSSQSPSPCLPPRLREAERMQHVQRWVNSIHIEALPDHHSIPETSTSSSSSTTTNRFFDDAETKQIVNLFRDFFQSGSCPGLAEVRKRIAATSLQETRNPVSVRSKVKRLITNGQWANHT